MKMRNSALLFVVFSLMLVGCSNTGKSPEDRTPKVTIFGTVDSVGYETVVCLDANHNMQCDDSEPQVTVPEDGEFEIPSWIDVEETSTIVAEFYDPSGSTTPALTLARPVDWTEHIDVLSTFVAVGMLKAPGSNPDGVLQELASVYGLEAADDLTASWEDIDDTVRAALIETMNLYRDKTETSRSNGEVALSTTSALVDSLRRYLKPDTAELNPLVSAYSLSTDAVGATEVELCPLPNVSDLTITTENHEPIVEKKVYLQAILEFSGGTTGDLTVSTRIRGRGNSTWGMPKKPYRLKLDEPTSLVGIPARRDWALLANYADKTMLRNALAFCVAYTLGMPYSPLSDFVEVTLNDEYLGLYQLNDKTYAVRDLVEEQAKETGNGLGAEDVFLLELDDRRNRDFNFDTSRGVPYGFRSKTDAGRAAAVENWVNEIENLIADSSNPDRLAAVNEVMDLESLVDLFLVNEFMRNADGFWSSTYTYKLRDTRFTFGPVWDFDIATGNVNYGIHWNPEGSSILGGGKAKAWFLQELMDEPEFEALVKARWDYLSAHFEDFEYYIRDSVVELDAAQERNFARWPILDEDVWPNYKVTGSYEGEIEYLLEWLSDRQIWMDSQYLP